VRSPGNAHLEGNLAPFPRDADMTLDNVQALPVGTQLGDYRLDAVIGHGGFGITYRAFDGQLAKVVAIKEYLPIEFAVRQNGGKVVPRGARFADDFAWGRDRFLDEARALARFRHPHIVPVLRFLEANGTAYTVMEFEDGRSVAEWLRQTGRRLPPPDARQLAEGLLSGLGAVHAQGFLHRDIKPSNVIIRRDGVPILIDFGAARQAIGGRTRTLTGVLTPQYAPIEQYALDGKQGPWSDIYSAAAVLHHAIAGEPPPDAASRIGRDPYRPLAVTQADRFDQTFLAAIDRALAFAPEQRPQSVAAWRDLFGASVPASDDTPTRRMAGATTVDPPVVTPRLGGVSRGEEVAPPMPARAWRAWPLWSLAVLVILAVAGALWWKWRPEVRELLAGVSAPATSSTSAAPSTRVPSETATAPVMPAPPADVRPADSATASITPAPVAPVPPVTDKALVDQAQHAAEEARTVLEKAQEAAAAARTMAGEARIAAARAARSGLENSQRLALDDGATYIGQVADGKPQGLGVTELGDGGRRAGEWQDELLNGRGIERLADGNRYEGQWRDGRRTGLGVADMPGVAHDEGNFVAGKLEGAGVHRSAAEPSISQAGGWRAGSLDGPGVETVGDRERYEGSFRSGKRHGYGQLTITDKAGADNKVMAGRWEDGKLVESAL
jgi:hypothetical protein